MKAGTTIRTAGIDLIPMRAITGRNGNGRRAERAPGRPGIRQNERVDAGVFLNKRAANSSSKRLAISQKEETDVLTT
jgi:hypothetical protein